jgi:hypothetical protein
MKKLPGKNSILRYSLSWLTIGVFIFKAILIIQWPDVSTGGSTLK